MALQEANALAIVDIAAAKVTVIKGLGVKDHSLANNGFGSSNALDASHRDGVPVANNGPDQLPGDARGLLFGRGELTSSSGAKAKISFGIGSSITSARCTSSIT